MLLPAEVPEVPETRTDVVPARLARKLAGLFGIRWAGNPFPLTWVCDYSALTVSEIARGAPARPGLPPPVEAASAPWTVVDRAVVSHGLRGARPAPLPNEIANATLNRFGPDTKAALVLTGANVLMAPVTNAIRNALSFLRQQAALAELPAAAQVGAWATLILAAYRSQPALVAAGLQARRVQRANLTDPDFVVPIGGAARCEIGGESAVIAQPDPRTHPRDLDLIDATLSAAFANLAAAAQPGAQRRQQDLVDRWLSRIEELGTSHGAGQLWLVDTADSHRRVEAFVPQDPIIDSFLDEIGCRLEGADGGINWALPSIPVARQLAGMPHLSKRCVALALCMLIRYSFDSGDPDPFADLHTLACLDALDDLVKATMPRTDPAAVIVLTRIADMRLEVLRQDIAYDSQLPAAVAELVDHLQTAHRLARRGAMSVGDAAEIASSGAVELLATWRRHQATEVPGLPPAEDLRTTLYELWRHTLKALGLDPERLLDQVGVTRPISFHLHNYATFLGRQPALPDVQHACDIFERLVIPSRRAYYARTGEFRPLLYALQNATPANTRLIDDAVNRGELAGAHDRALLGRAWIRDAVAAPHTQRLLDRASIEASDEACRFALLAAPALLSALELRASPTPLEDVRICNELLVVADLLAERFGKVGGHYSRSAEIIAIRDRLDAYTEGWSRPTVGLSSVKD
jgi:hypothetical protein